MNSDRPSLVIPGAVIALAVTSACASGGRPVAADSPRSPATFTLIERQMLAATVDTIAAHLPDSTSLCLTFMGGPDGPVFPDDAFLTTLRTRQRPLRGDNCPPTYTQMVRHVDSTGHSVDPVAPAGYVDPYQLTVGRPQFAMAGYAWIHIRQLQGTSGRAYLCAAQAYDGQVWAGCRAIDSWIH